MEALLTSSTNLRFHPISLSNFLDFAICLTSFLSFVWLYVCSRVSCICFSIFSC